jgi:hypothetical protein
LHYHGIHEAVSNFYPIDLRHSPSSWTLIEKERSAASPEEGFETY